MLRPTASCNRAHLFVIVVNGIDGIVLSSTRNGSPIIAFLPNLGKGDIWLKIP